MSPSINSSEIPHPVAKAFGAAASAGAGIVAELTTAILSGFPWGELAAALGVFYTLLVITEWWWKRFWRPLLIRLGWWSPSNPYFRPSGRVPLDEEER